MTERTYNVLFLCTGNSARSILAEAILNHDGAGRFKGYSAGSFPKGKVHPMAIEVLRGLGFPYEGYWSKSWDEFAADGAPVFDFIFNVCDNAAGETCPIWPGHPMTAHWGIEDPAAVEGDGQHEAFVQALRFLRRRIELFLALPLSAIDDLALKAIGQGAGASGLAEQPAGAA